jgi:hypothetical protein
LTVVGAAPIVMLRGSGFAAIAETANAASPAIAIASVLFMSIATHDPA